MAELVELVRAVVREVPGVAVPVDIQEMAELVELERHLVVAGIPQVVREVAVAAVAAAVVKGVVVLTTAVVAAVGLDYWVRVVTALAARCVRLAVAADQEEAQGIMLRILHLRQVMLGCAVAAAAAVWVHITLCTPFTLVAEGREECA